MDEKPARVANAERLTASFALLAFPHAVEEPAELTDADHAANAAVENFNAKAERQTKEQN